MFITTRGCRNEGLVHEKRSNKKIPRRPSIYPSHNHTSLELQLSVIIDACKTVRSRNHEFHSCTYSSQRVESVHSRILQTWRISFVVSTRSCRRRAERRPF